MHQAQAMQANMQKAQAEIASLEVTGEAGGGMVKVVMNGRHEAKRVQIEPTVVAEESRDARGPRGRRDQRCARKLEARTQEKMRASCPA